MRTLRVVILAAFLFTTIILTTVSLRSSHKGQLLSTKKADSPAGFRAFFSFNTPLSLFPPNAIISLTDDNTTYFLARPANFGPLLPMKGLDGELWIGSGFGADSLSRGGIVAGAEGELGCSDVPDYVDGSKKLVVTTGKVAALPEKKLSALPDGVKSEKRRRGSDDTFGDRTAAFGHLQAGSETRATPAIDDGTDDYLHHHLVDSKTKQGKGTNNPHTGLQASHADIQSMQEGAEIAGKVVLLSRGGCGFLEKVKWVQRRGGIALIVGDDTKGGQLIQMYARGDTTNVTIPAVFTSWTTAHLLSKLMPSGSVSDDAVDENGKPIRKPTRKPKKFTKKPLAKVTPKVEKKSSSKSSGGGWFSSMFFKSKPGIKRETTKGNDDWVLVEDWDEKANSKKGTGKKKLKTPLKTTPSGNKDGFIIGEQDWRDPDLMVNNPKAVTTSKPTKQSVTGQGAKSTNKAMINPSTGVKGGSITPGSGQYKEGHSVNIDSKSEMKKDKAKGSESDLVSKIFGEDEDESDIKPLISTEPERDDYNDDEDTTHEGLWVTLTPTTGSSPFFDTLLVLVISPLFTLTIVYALLLVRSRIRRRRWRAPKSVVERLPVRTYQTVRSNPHSRLPSPTLTPTVTTPLLQDSSVRPRPRSQTTSGLPEPGELLRTNSSSSHISRAPSPRAPSRGPPEHEKGVASEWKKYMGKQVECVVCLEEYVDGVSRVMSLPCGHEFHVDCMYVNIHPHLRFLLTWCSTPWLTTRRRTCPICKGDVVRSIARGSPSTPRYDAYHDDDSDDDIQVQAAETVNTLPAAALPIPTGSDSNTNDLESGIISPTPSRPRRFNEAGSWRSLLSSSIASSSRSPRPATEDRTR
jgi:hypothetical protein